MTVRTKLLAMLAAASAMALSAVAAHAGPIFGGNFGTTVLAGDNANPANPYGLVNAASNSPVTYNFSVSSLDPGVRPTSILSFANISAETSMAPLPHVQVSAQTTGEYQAGGTAGLRYDLRAFILGDHTGITSIPLIIEGHYDTSVLGLGYATASLGLSGVDSNPVFTSNCINTGLETVDIACGSRDFAYAFSLDTANFGGAALEGFVSLSVTAGTYMGDTPDSRISTAQAFLDPIIYIDPAFLALHPNVTFFSDGSSGITDAPPPGARGLGGGGDTGGVPEPATWALMIMGFGLAGAALRRHRAPLTA